MTDRYQDLAHSRLGRLVVKNLGLPDPPYLQRWTPGARLVDGPVLVGSAAPGPVVDAVRAALKASRIDATGVRADGRRYRALVFDASAIDSAAGLVALQQFFTPVLRQLTRSGRVVVLGRIPAEAGSEGASIAQRALEGFTRSLGKEVGGGSSVNLVHVAHGAEGALRSTLDFLLSPKSAYVSGQVVQIGATGLTGAPVVADPDRPLAGKVALVTGASRGLGAADLRTLARDGATVIGLDVPSMGDDLAALTGELGGGHLVADITSPETPEIVASYVAEHHGTLDVLVHNAGVTRDKRLKNMTAENWNLVVDISVGAPQRITDHLLDRQVMADDALVVGIASIAGIAGNNGQTNYAAAKAGVIGWIESLAARGAATGLRANVVAPGFMETDMVRTIPLATREAGRRMNSMSQGGQPVDVAETIAWLAHPGSSAISGNVIGVNGQMLLGAS